MVPDPERPNSNPPPSEGGGQDLTATAPAGQDEILEALRDLVTEAAELARHLLDAGTCPECGGGECEPCNGLGITDDRGDSMCDTCKGEGTAPHEVDCRLVTFPARAARVLGGGQ